jgi:hypothetical protein
MKFALLLSIVFSTIAGSGASGVKDGPGASASFLFPYGIAVATDGTIYVSDFMGQRIRSIDSHFVVRTVAGGGTLQPDGLRIDGSYVDGPAAGARFNYPAGIALDSKGVLYIADSGNHCIRVLDHGVVRTFAGSPNRGVADGMLAGAGFDTPRALAFDRDGNLWVGDARVGLRKITPAGVVSTVSIPTQYGGNFVTSIVPEPDGLMLVDDEKVVFLQDPDGPPAGVKFSFPMQDVRNGGLAQASVRTGDAFAVTDLTPDVHVFTDPHTQAIRLFDYSNFVETLSESPGDAYAVSGGGYRDGPSGLVQTPLGIAATGRDRLVFVDAGNRRIRAIAGITPTHFEHNQRAPFGDDASRYYRIIVLGNSFVGWGVPFNETIAGRLQAQLNAHRAGLHIPKPVRVALIYQGHASDVLDYVRQFVSKGGADLFVWEFNDAVANEEYHDVIHEAQPSTQNPMPFVNVWKPSIAPKIAQVGDNLRAAHEPFYVVLQPMPTYFPFLEWWDPRQSFLPPDWDPIDAVYHRLFDGNVNAIVDGGPAMLNAEKSASRRFLFLTDGEAQPSAAGDAILAALLYQRLATDKPWEQSPR